MLSSSLAANQPIESRTDELFKKRTELPIYTECTLQSLQNEEGKRNELILRGVQLVRSEGCNLIRTLQFVSDRYSIFFKTGVAHASCMANYVTTVNYLREERNILQRIGVVGVGSLFGYTLGLRKGFLKRCLYTSTGSITAAALCYPSEAENYLKQSSVLAKKYVIFGYHFLNGVSKDLTGYELSAFPLKSLSQESPSSVKKD